METKEQQTVGHSKDTANSPGHGVQVWLSVLHRQSSHCRPLLGFLGPQSVTCPSFTGAYISLSLSLSFSKRPWLFPKQRYSLWLSSTSALPLWNEAYMPGRKISWSVNRQVSKNWPHTYHVNNRSRFKRYVEILRPGCFLQIVYPFVGELKHIRRVKPWVWFEESGSL